MLNYKAVIIGGTGFEGLDNTKETEDGPYVDFKKTELRKYAKLYDVMTPKGYVLAVNRQPKIKHEDDSETQIRGYETDAEIMFNIVMPYLDGIDTVRAISAVGGIYETRWVRRLFNKYILGRKNVKMKVGDIIAVRDHIDFWHIAKNEGFADYWHGYNLYDKELTDELVRKSSWILDNGNYFCSRSNRFESPAERELAKIVGANMFGMTATREANEARKREFKRFSLLGIVTNDGGTATTAEEHSIVSARMFKQAFNAHMKTV